MSETGRISAARVSVELSFSERHFLERMLDPVESFHAEPLREPDGARRKVDTGRLIGAHPTGTTRTVRNRMDLAEALMARIPERCPGTYLREAVVGDTLPGARAMPALVTLSSDDAKALPSPSELAEYVSRAVRDAFDEAYAPTHDREPPAPTRGM